MNFLVDFRRPFLLSFFLKRDKFRDFMTLELITENILFAPLRQKLIWFIVLKLVDLNKIPRKFYIYSVEVCENH